MIKMKVASAYMKGDKIRLVDTVVWICRETAVSRIPHPTLSIFSTSKKVGIRQGILQPNKSR